MAFPTHRYILTAITQPGDPNLGWEDGYTEYRWSDVHVDGLPLVEEDDPRWFALFCAIERHARCGEVKVVVDPLTGIVSGLVVSSDGSAELVKFSLNDASSPL